MTTNMKNILLHRAYPGAFAAVGALLCAPTPAQAQTQEFFACFVPNSGVVYRVNPPGSPGESPNLKDDCTGKKHVKFSWAALAVSDGKVGEFDVDGTVGASAFASASPLIFEAPKNTERMRIDDNTGNVGIGTTTPTATLDVAGTNGFVVTGTFGTGAIPASGAGVRIMWYPQKAAFRVGRVLGTEWNDANIGLGSVAMGRNTTASGDLTTAMGSNTTASGLVSTAMGRNTTASGDLTTAMGTNTTASGVRSTAMGSFTTASGLVSTAMGFNTTASGRRSTAMGRNTTASGDFSTAMGRNTTASGDFTTAMGSSASTNSMAGSFVYGDNSSHGSTINVQANNSFVVRAAGGTTFFSNSTLSSGVSLAAGAGAWASVSDRNRKENFRTEDGESVLEKIADMPIPSWRYKAQDASIRHLGPMSQDFYAAFGLGQSDLTITTSDISGINMLAIQALETRTRDLDDVRTELAETRQRLAALETAVARLEAVKEANQR